MSHNGQALENAKLERLVDIARDHGYGALVEGDHVTVYIPVTLNGEHVTDDPVTVRSFRALRFALGY